MCYFGRDKNLYFLQHFILKRNQNPVKSIILGEVRNYGDDEVEMVRYHGNSGKKDFNI